MSKVKITERGWAGHFIAARLCLFRRNTLIEYRNIKIVVSTVGSLVASSTMKIDMVGHNRWYETKAFIAKEYGEYIEADASKPIEFSSEWGMFAENYEELILKYGNDIDNVANKMHDDVVYEIAKKIMAEEMERRNIE